MKNIVLMDISYWLILFLISISKPISDYFWLGRFRETKKLFAVVKLLRITIKSPKKRNHALTVHISNKYLINFFYCLLIGFTAISLSYLSEASLIVKILIFGFATAIFMSIVVMTIRSILVCCLFILCIANYSFINIFLPFNELNDLSTLNSVFTNLISVLNFFLLIMTFAFGALWQFSRHIDEDIYGTISTVFYMFGYVSLNVILAVIFLIYPIAKQIQVLAA